MMSISRTIGRPRTAAKGHPSNELIAVEKMAKNLN
jgi:hypothetical protein